MPLHDHEGKIGLEWFWTAKNGRQYVLEFVNISYNCRALKLYGYATERQLQNAINRKTKEVSNGH